jgi:hypothetical protein
MQEEQRVIEAKIRIQQQELQAEEERMLKRQEVSCSSGNMASVEDEYSSVAGIFSILCSVCILRFSIL